MLRYEAAIVLDKDVLDVRNRHCISAWETELRLPVLKRTSSNEWAHVL